MTSREITQRNAKPGELCTCGRPAAVVFNTRRFGEIGWCAEAGAQAVKPCVFCGDTDAHDNEKCPDYALTLDEMPAEILEVAGLVLEVRDGYLAAYTDLDRTTLALRMPLTRDELGALGAWLADHAEAGDR